MVSRLLLAVPATVLALAVALVGTQQHTLAQQSLPDEVENAVREDAAERAGVSESDVQIVEWQSVTWNDACLGAREPGEFCAQVVTPGFIVWATAGGDLFRYHTDTEGTIRIAQRSPLGDPGDDIVDATTYVVQPGDTLALIAARFGTSVFALVELNNIADPDVIHVGQVLVVPGGGDGGDDGTGEQPITGTYVVQSGDTLALIAARFGTTVSAIASANNIANPDLIFVGQVLEIPGAGDGTGEQPTTQTYVVQSGDTLFSIATRFGTSVSAIVEANNIANPDLIFPGQVLEIPS